MLDILSSISEEIEASERLYRLSPSDSYLDEEGPNGSSSKISRGDVIDSVRNSIHRQRLGSSG